MPNVSGMKPFGCLRKVPVSIFQTNQLEVNFLCKYSWIMENTICV